MKKIFLVVFSLIMICSVSFAYYVTPNLSYSSNGTNKSVSGSSYLGTSYTTTQVKNILKYLQADRNNETYISNFNDLTSEMTSLGYKWIVLDTGDDLLLFSSYNYDVEFAIKKVGSSYYVGVLYTRTSGSNDLVYLISKDSNLTYLYARTGSDVFCYSKKNFNELYACNCDIYTDTDTSTSSFTWDGSSYFYKLPEQGGDSGDNVPDFTDEQIAEIVERFINSNAYLEKAYYNGDYFITYDNLTGYFRGYSYSWNIDLAIEYGNYDEEGNFITTGTTEGEAWRIRPYEFSGDIFNKFGDWLASKFNTYSFEYFSISPDSSIEPRYIGSLEHNYCSNYVENETVIYSTKQIRYVGEETDDEGNTETVVTDNYIPPTVLKDSETGEEIIIRDKLQNSSDSLENVITPNADFSGLKEVFEKYISFVNISSITWLTTAISSMITIFVPFVALGIIIFLINRILNGGS